MTSSWCASHEAVLKIQRQNKRGHLLLLAPLRWSLDITEAISHPLRNPLPFARRYYYLCLKSLSCTLCFPRRIIFCSLLTSPLLAAWWIFLRGLYLGLFGTETCFMSRKKSNRFFRGTSQNPKGVFSLLPWTKFPMTKATGLSHLCLPDPSDFPKDLSLHPLIPKLSISLWKIKIVPEGLAPRLQSGGNGF